MGNVMQVDWEAPQPSVVSRAADALRSGGVAVLPTDTVYGVSQSVLASPGGAHALFSIKRRPPEKAIPWLVADASDLDEYGIDVPGYAHALAARFWPGGLTLVVEASSRVPNGYRGPEGTIALRMPASPPVIAIVRELGCPLATTSANTSGMPAPDSFSRLEPRIIEESDIALDDGRVHSLASSTIVVCTGQAPLIVRHGALADSDIVEACAEAGAGRLTR